jgi:hypothetical protein
MKSWGWNYLPGCERFVLIPQPFRHITKILLYFRQSRSVHDFGLSDEVPVSDDVLENLLGIRNERFYSSQRPYCYYDLQIFKWRLSNKYAGYNYLYFDQCLVVYKVRTLGDSFKELLIGDIFLYKHERGLFNSILKELLIIEKPHLVYTYISSEHDNYEFFRQSSLISRLFRKDVNFGVKPLNESAQHILLGGNVWQTSIFDIDTF